MKYFLVDFRVQQLSPIARHYFSLLLCYFLICETEARSKVNNCGWNNKIDGDAHI